MVEMFVGRQPIYDRDLEVVGYEMLFRSGEANVANVATVDDGDHATSDVINHLLETGLDKLVGDHLAFINCTRSVLLSEDPLPVAKDRVVLEVLEDVTVDDDLIVAIGELRDEGFQIALDDFVDNLAPLVDTAHIIKLDLMVTSRDKLTQQVSELRDRGVKLLAEKVETFEDFHYCKELGFDMFQGFFFSRPNIVKSQRLPASRLSLLRLLSQLSDPNIEMKDLEVIVSQDVTLSYKVLRLINSAFYGLSRKIESIRQTLVMLGINRIRSLVNVLLLSRIDDKPTELMVTAMIRAKMSEQLADYRGLDDIQKYFTIGLFSALDALMDLPMDEVLQKLPLADELNKALRSHRGPGGEILKTVLAYEKGDWDEVELEGVEPADIREAYLTAVEWADDARKEIDG